MQATSGEAVRASMRLSLDVRLPLEDSHQSLFSRARMRSCGRFGRFTHVALKPLSSRFGLVASSWQGNLALPIAV